MSEVRIRRGGTGRMSVKPKKSASGRRTGGAKGRGKSPVNALLARLPIAERTLQRGITWSVVIAVVVVLVGVATFFGLPGMAHMEMAEFAAKTGYEVKKVQVTGTSRMDERQVYNIALGEVDRSMMNVDLDRLRQDIMRLPWVKDARISRRLPDTLAVDIVERTPAAVWQHEGQLALIDASGAVLEPVSVDAMPDLPLVVGDQANLQAERLARLMEAAPALKPVLAGATWVGNRRWDLRFQSGETLALPEGDETAAAALVEFARLDGINRLLGRNIVRFDMRDPDKFVLRLPKGQGGAALPADTASVPEKPTGASTLPATEEKSEPAKSEEQG
ncbi:MAG: cell division protein FtsQ/DivIB [Sphingobium sp.]